MNPFTTDDEFRKGDIVRAAKGDTIIEGALESSGNDLYIVTPGIGIYDLSLRPAVLRAEGYEVTLVKRARPEFVPGVYRDSDGDLRFRDVQGRWYLLNIGTATSRADLANPWHSSDDIISDDVSETLTLEVAL
jgi:hypothetical protein